MTLPVGAATATITVGAAMAHDGAAGTLVSLQVWPEVPAGLVWAADGTMIEPWSAVGTAGTLTILADQPGVLTSGTVDGTPALVAITGWPLVATWVTRMGAGAPTKHVRRFAAPAAGATVDLDLLPEAGVTTPGTVTYAQTIQIGGTAPAALTDLTDVTIGDSAEGDVLRLGPLGEWGPSTLDAADVGADPAGTAAGLVSALVIPNSPDDINASPASHTHTSLHITDWAEAVQDAVAAMLVSGANVTLAYDDTLGKVTVTAVGGDAEVMRDTIGAALVGTGGVVVAVNDAADTITLSIAAGTYAPALGADDNYVTDAEKAALHTHPAVIAQGADAAAARTAIGAAGTVGQEFTATAPAATFGADLAPSIGSWTGAGGATYGGSSWNIPSGGTVSANIPVTSGTMYQIDLTRTGSSGGNMVVSLGSATIEIPAGGNNQLTLTATTTGTVALTIGGGSWVCAALSGVTARPVTALPSPAASFAGQTLRSANSSIGLGAASQQSLTTGNNNVAAGYTSQYSLTTGSSNVAAGYASQYSLTTGSNNVAAGYLSQRSLTTGSNNVAAGYASQQSLTTGSSNVAVGTSTQYSLTTGSSNVAAGYASQRSLTTGSNNVAAGYASQYSLTTGSNNVAVGTSAQQSPRVVPSWATTTASRQTSVGHESGQGSSTPSDDIVTVGYRAVADGHKAMALGSMATANHAGSVALGADVTTTATGQIAIGPRDLEVQDAAKGVVLRSPDGSRWRVTIDNTGVTTWTKL